MKNPSHLKFLKNRLMIFGKTGNFYASTCDMFVVASQMSALDTTRPVIFSVPIPWRLATVSPHGITTKLEIRSTLYHAHI